MCVSRLNPLSDDETAVLKERLYEIDRDIVVSGGWKRLSGGFATADMYDYDDDNIYVEVKEGIVNDVEKRVYTYNMTLDRKTMKIKKE